MPQIDALSWPSDLGKQYPDAIQIYSGEWVANLCKDFCIPADRSERLFEKLAVASTHYLSLRAHRQAKRTKKENRNALSAIERTASKLEAQLAEALEEFDAPLAEAWEEFSLALHVQDDPDLLKIGAAWRSNVLGHDGYESLELSDALAAVRMVKLCAGRSLALVKPDRDGRKRFLDVEMFVQHHCAFWTNTLERKVTIDRHQGRLTTEVGRYLEAVMNPLDPAAVAKLPQALESCRRRNRQTHEN